MKRKFNYQPNLSHIYDYEYYHQLDNSAEFDKLFSRCIYENHLGSTDCELDQEGYLWTDWCPSDTEEQFILNTLDPKSKKLLISQGWLDENSNPINEFRYRLNNNFFRCNHFENKPSLVTMGCSFTFGIGLPEESLWCTKLADYLNLELYNLGSPGKSLAISAYYFMQNYERFFTNCKAIAILNPPPTRVDLVTLPRVGDAYFSSMRDLLNDPNKEIDMNDMRNRVTANSLFPTGYFYEKFSMLAIKQLAQHNNIPVINFRSDAETAHTANQQDWARDLAHQGPLWQESIYNEFVELFDSLS